jgi:ElaB/YqjD/DUF883 family membrane-anchored ribosome-binding protein
MDERRLESIQDTAQRSARRMAGDAQAMASRAGSYAQERAQEMQERAQEMVERYTGRPADTWMRDARRFVQDHPLQAVAITIGLGFVLGKILARD